VCWVFELTRHNIGNINIIYKKMLASLRKMLMQIQSEYDSVI